MAKDTASGAGAQMHSGDETGGTPRKRRAPEGPRKTKPVHLAVHVTDKDGNHIPDAKVEVHKASKDFETIYGHMEANPGLSRVRVALDNVG